MTTARSPLRVLKAQADKIAMALKAAERGETIATDPAGKIAAARTRESVTFAVVMDDKVLKIELPWATVRETSEVGIAEYILKQMREARDVQH
jgi:hypothetical protein